MATRHKRSHIFPRFLRDNGLTLCLILLFVFSFGGQILAGHAQHNETRREHGQAAIALSEYLVSGEFLEVTFENWESEFLQMALYVWLTSFLYQRGSAESKDPDKSEEVDEDPREHKHDRKAPLPVRRGGMLLWLYERSLVLALFALFLVSFGAHLIGSTKESCQDQIMHGMACDGILAQLGSSRFWFESFQNWQSEFLSIAALALLSIVLRQRGSPESKPVHAPHDQTGKG